MGKKDIEKQKLLMEALDFQADSATTATFGNVNGYPVIAVAGGTNIGMAKEKYWSLIFSVQSFSPEEQKVNSSELQKSSKAIKSATWQQNRFWVTVKYSSNEEQNKENLREAMQLTTEFLKANGYKAVCQLSGRTDDLVCCVLKGHYLIANREELLKASGEILSASEKEAVTKENVAVGALGALLGSVIGAASIVIIGLMGYISSLSGLIMGIATIALYRLFARKITWKGFLVSGISIAIFTYLAYRVSLAIELVKSFELSFGYAFSQVPFAFEPEFYYTELIKLYAFVILGAVIAFIGYIQRNKADKVTHVMG